MPIKGMTDQAPSFPQIGVIRKGAPRPKDGKRPGKDLEWFRVVFDEEETEAAETFAKVYGEQPQEINILIPFDEIDRNWEAWREAYVAGALLHRCDGENLVYAIDHETGEILVQNGLSVKTHQVVPCDGKAKCKPSGRLRVIVPELRRLAYLMVLTTSIHDIVNISKQLLGIKTMNGDRLRGIPLVLRRRPKNISTPSGANGKRARRPKWLLSIEADPKWVQAKLQQIEAASFPALPAPSDPYFDDALDKYDDAYITDAEFTTTGDAEEEGIGIPLNGNDNGEEKIPPRWFEDEETLTLAKDWLKSKGKTWTWGLGVLEVEQIEEYPGTRGAAKELWQAAIQSAAPKKESKQKRQTTLM